MDKTEIKTAIFFSDVVGSSNIYKQKGDQKANAAITKCVEMMGEEVERHQGIVVKTLGDEVMARFEIAAQACAAAIAIQRNSYNDPEGLNIRIGAAFGSAILKNSDVFGEVVNDAAAVAKVAQAHQILITQPFADELNDLDEDITLHTFDKIVMKGGQSTTVIHRVAWEPLDITINATQVLEAVNLQPVVIAPHIDLKYLEQDVIKKEIKVTPKNTPFIVGRDPNACSLGVPTTFASRDHFHIIHRRGKFILKDHSTNGTYVIADDTADVYLRREEMQLRGNGVIGMGQSPDEADHVIRFECAQVEGPAGSESK
jgi:class 3 adenylate cyclase